MGSRRLVPTTAALLMVLMVSSARAQDFRLSDCRITHQEGQLVKLSCGGTSYWVVGRELAAECAAFKRDCPAWQARSALLDETVEELERGRVLLNESTLAIETYQRNEAVLDAQIADLTDDLRSHWTTLEIIGVAAIVLVGGFSAGVVVGVFAL